jgi:hypothetical protein
MRSGPLFLLLFLLGCSGDFAPYSNLATPRVLAMRSEPAMPGPGIPARFAALTYVPAGAPATYQWSYCPVAARAADRYACPLPWDAAAAVFGPTLPAYDLGTGATADFQHDLDPAALARLCATGIATPAYAGAVDCDLGFPLTVTLDQTTGGQTLRAAFQVYLPIDDQAVPNANPGLEDLLAGDLPVGAALAAAPEQAVVFTVKPAADAVEARPIPAFEGAPGTRAERLTFSWFAEAGSWDKDRTAFLDGETPLADATRNTWTAPAADAWVGPAWFHVVARDDRGGVSWISRQVTLGGQP